MRLSFDKSVQKKADKTRRKKPDIFEICQYTVAPLALRNNDYSDDDKRLVIRYSAICRRERPSGIHTDTVERVRVHAVQPCDQ